MVMNLVILLQTHESSHMIVHFVKTFFKDFVILQLVS
jgi:hypothetical protein